MAELEDRIINEVLQRSDGNKSLAAKHLGISVRTLRNKINHYGLR